MHTSVYSMFMVRVGLDGLTVTNDLCHDAIYLFDSKGSDVDMVGYYLFVHVIEDK